MEISLSKYDLKQFIKDQLAFYLPDRYVFSGDDVDKALNLSLERTEYCFKFIAIDAYHNNGQTYFYHLHTDQYSQFPSASGWLPPRDGGSQDVHLCPRLPSRCRTWWR